MKLREDLKGKLEIGEEIYLPYGDVYVKGKVCAICEKFIYLHNGAIIDLEAYLKAKNEALEGLTI